MPDKPKLIALFTDFGIDSPYLGQMHAVLAASGVKQTVIQLIADAPRFAPCPSAYLLSAIARDMPGGTMFICVVDPGVGSDRRPIIVRDSDQWFVGPDNGLLSQVARRSGKAEIEEIVWRPEKMSNSFHGRDLFAPVAAAICSQEYKSGPGIQADTLAGAEWPDDLAEIIYVDAFGNAITGIRSSSINNNRVLDLCGTPVKHARTFSDAPSGAVFWYENSMGLVEIAVNHGSASQLLDVDIGSQIDILG